MPDKLKSIPLDDAGEAVITEAMVDAAFQSQVWKDIERCVKIAFQTKSFQPFTHAGWRDSPVAELFKLMVREMEASAPAVMWEWQPIETAPRDGQEVLLYYPLEGLSDVHAKIIIGYWREPEIAQGYWVWQSRAVRGYSHEYQPTHWKPLRSPSSEALS